MAQHRGYVLFYSPVTGYQWGSVVYVNTDVTVMHMYNCESSQSTTL